MKVHPLSRQVVSQDEFGEILMCNHGERHETSGCEWWGSEKPEAGGEKMEERATSHPAARQTRLTLSDGAKTT